MGNYFFTSEATPSELQIPILNHNRKGWGDASAGSLCGVWRTGIREGSKQRPIECDRWPRKNEGAALDAARIARRWLPHARSRWNHFRV